MTVLASWELVALIAVILWVFWRFLNWTFDLIEQASAGRRSREAESPDGERGA